MAETERAERDAAIAIFREALAIYGRSCVDIMSTDVGGDDYQTHGKIINDIGATIERLFTKALDDALAAATPTAPDAGDDPGPLGTGWRSTQAFPATMVKAPIIRTPGETIGDDPDETSEFVGSIQWLDRQDDLTVQQVWEWHIARRARQQRPLSIHRLHDGYKVAALPTAPDAECDACDGSGRIAVMIDGPDGPWCHHWRACPVCAATPTAITEAMIEPASVAFGFSYWEQKMTLREAMRAALEAALNGGTE